MNFCISNWTVCCFVDWLLFCLFVCNLAKACQVIYFHYYITHTHTHKQRAHHSSVYSLWTLQYSSFGHFARILLSEWTGSSAFIRLCHRVYEIFRILQTPPMNLIELMCDYSWPLICALPQSAFISRIEIKNNPIPYLNLYGLLRIR